MYQCVFRKGLSLATVAFSEHFSLEASAMNHKAMGRSMKIGRKVVAQESCGGERKLYIHC